MQTKPILAGLAATFFTLALAPAALADDWVATKLRGKVLTLVDGQWQPLGRGDVVSDERIIRTLRGGRVTLQRDAEVIEVADDTQIRIYDRSGRKFTTVLQDFGTVSVEADVREVQHFSVKTPHIAAVVKGTRFTVTSGERAAEVTVQRGSVAVADSDTHQTTTVVAGQSAGTSAGAPLTVAGRGELPAIRNADGTVVDPRKAAEQAAAASARNAALAAGLSGKEADKAAREAAKEAREDARLDSRGSDTSGNSDFGKGSGGNGSGNAGNGGGNSSGSDNSGNANSGNGGGNSGSGSGNAGNGNGNGHGRQN